MINGKPPNGSSANMAMTKKGCLLAGCLIPLAVVVLFTILIVVDSLLPTPQTQSELPVSATDVRVYHSGGLHPDFLTLVKARLPRRHLDIYLDNLDITVKYDPTIHSDIRPRIDMGAGDAPDWWDEPGDMDVCYFNYTPDREYLERVKWKDGWVYFFRCSW